MTILLAGLLALVAFVVLVRLLWITTQPRMATGIVTLAAATLVISLALLVATGRIHWLVALGAAVVPFLRRIAWLVPFIGKFMSSRPREDSGRSRTQPPPEGEMSSTRACEVLGLGPHPAKEEIIGAHRRLMQKVHPDRGGSTFLAQQLNEAKRVLLKDR